MIPYNPAVVFHKLSISSHHTTTDASTPTSDTHDNTDPSLIHHYKTGFLLAKYLPPLPISTKIKEVTEVEELVSLFRDQTLYSTKLALLHKNLKAARVAMADRVVLNRTNTELFAANTQKNDELNVLVFNTTVEF